jgi:hypothetical protein
MPSYKMKISDRWQKLMVKRMKERTAIDDLIKDAQVVSFWDDDNHEHLRIKWLTGEIVEYVETEVKK